LPEQLPLTLTPHDVNTNATNTNANNFFIVLIL
jgi:hypothetical protein